MKVVILCGGMGTRLSEETHLRPKPMVEVGTHPLLWHIMNIYDVHGFKDFVLALGYKGDVIKEYFLDYYALNSDLRIDLSNGAVSYLKKSPREWKIDLVDTGEASMTGGRVKRLESSLRREGTFMLTYGDGVSDINVRELVAFHKAHKKVATVTAVRPPARFGGMEFDGNRVLDFKEKPQAGEGWVNGGFFVFEPEVFDYIKDDQSVLEGEPLERLTADGQLMAYKHTGFWQCMDTVRDRQLLQALWDAGEAPWKKW